MANDKRRVIGLVRLSTDEQAKQGRGGLLRQRADIEDLVRANNFELARVEEVIDVSGMDVLTDPTFQRIFQDLASPDIHGVVASHVDRWGRPQTYADFAIFDPFLINRKKLWTKAQGEIDPSTRSGKIMSLLFGNQAGDDLADIRSKTMDAKEGLRKQGRHTAASWALPYGVEYQTVKTENGTSFSWSYVEPYASRVKLAFELLLTGVAEAEIARRCGYGGASSVRRILENPIWIGIRRYSVRCTPKLLRKCHPDQPKFFKREMPLDVVIPELQKNPLVSPEMFAAAQARLLEIRKRWTKTTENTSVNNFLGVGVLRCSCGEALYAWACERNGHNYDRYICASGKLKGRTRCGFKAIRRDVLDPVLEKMITERLTSPALLIDTMNAYAKRTKPAVSPQATESKLKKVRERLDRAYEYFLEGRIDRDQYRNEKETGAARIRELESLLTSTPAQEQSRRQQAQSVAHAFAEFRFWKLKDKKALLRRAVKDITVDGDVIVSLMIKGGFLGELAVRNSEHMSGASARIPNALPDLLIRFDNPIAIQ